MLIFLSVLDYSQSAYIDQLQFDKLYILLLLTRDRFVQVRSELSLNTLHIIHFFLLHLLIFYSLFAWISK